MYLFMGRGMSRGPEKLEPRGLPWVNTALASTKIRVESYLTAAGQVYVLLLKHLLHTFFYFNINGITFSQSFIEYIKYKKIIFSFSQALKITKKNLNAKYIYNI